MASATYDSVKRVRAAIGQEQRRAGASGARWRSERSGARRPSEAPGRGILRGVGASVLIASGYVACVTGIRWLLVLA